MFFSVVTGVLYSCSTGIRTFDWLDTKDSTRVSNNVMVLCLLRDLEYRNAIEEQLATSLKTLNYNAVQSLTVLSPTDKLSKEDFSVLLKSKDINTVIGVKYEGSVIQKTTDNRIRLYTFYRRFYRHFFKRVYIERTQNTIFQATLFNVETGKDVWVATIKIKDFGSVTELAKILADEIIKQLKVRKLIN
ncbi:MAG: hypothetical protein ACP5P3_07720 [Ignavibacteria bacterium]